MTKFCDSKHKSENMELPFIPEDLIVEILSWLPVKSLFRFKCVSHSFQSLISDSMFVKMHLQKSYKNVNFLLNDEDRSCTISWSLSSLLKNLSPSPSPSPLHVNHLGPVFDLKFLYRDVVGTCNGLVCYVSCCSPGYKFCLWNPATRQTFENRQRVLPSNNPFVNLFGFGYDTTTDNYKVVALLSTLNSEDDSLKSYEAKVCTIGDNGWRTVQDFPADTFVTVQIWGVYVNNSLNWIASSVPLNHFLDSYVSCENLVIVSLDMGSERCTHLLLPQVLDGVYTNVPRVGILNDCLSLFLIDYSNTCFSIWQVKEFGNRNSWIQFFHINIMQDIDSKIPYHSLLLQTFIYDRRNKEDEFSNHIISKDYVQSLVNPRRRN